MAVEEALSNAVYHKGYDEREPIEVRIEADRIIIISHPGADRSISREGLKEFRVYSRRYRNRRIGEFLKEMHLTEGRNTGFRKIRNALKMNGSPDPLFETDDERTYFSTTLYIHKGFQDDGGTHQENHQENHQEATAAKILAFCVEPRTMAEILALCGYKDRGNFMKRHLKPLLVNGQLLRTIPEQPTAKSQKYVTATKQ